MLLAAEVTVLLGGFAYASVADLRVREVTDRLWQVMGILGVALGAVAVSSGGPVPVVFWLAVGGFTLQHLFPWDDALGAKCDRFADVIEGVAYLAIILIVAIAAVRVGVGPTQVPIPVLALLLTVLFARGLFELGVLYGGADAKALMIAGVLVPIFSNPLLLQTPAVSALLTVLPVLREPPGGRGPAVHRDPDRDRYPEHRARGVPLSPWVLGLHDRRS